MSDTSQGTSCDYYPAEPLSNEQHAQAALKEFAEAAGKKLQLSVTTNWNSLQCSTHRKYLREIEQVLDACISTIAPRNYAEAVTAFWSMKRNDALSIYGVDEHFSIISQSLCEAYENAESREIREMLLGLIARQFNFQLCQEIVPGITYYRYLQAKKDALLLGTGVVPQPAQRIIQRFSEAAVLHFVDFFTSTAIMCERMYYYEIGQSWSNENFYTLLLLHKQNFI